MYSLYHVRNEIMYVLLWRTVYALTRVLFWCLFPSLLRNSGNKHQNNTLMSAWIVRHASTYIILYIFHEEGFWNTCVISVFKNAEECAYIFMFLKINSALKGLICFYTIWHIDGLVQDCTNSSALAMEELQSCTKPSTYIFIGYIFFPAWLSYDHILRGPPIQSSGASQDPRVRSHRIQ